MGLDNYQHNKDDSGGREFIDLDAEVHPDVTSIAGSVVDDMFEGLTVSERQQIADQLDANLLLLPKEVKAEVHTILKNMILIAPKIGDESHQFVKGESAWIQLQFGVGMLDISVISLSVIEAHDGRIGLNQYEVNNLDVMLESCSTNVPSPEISIGHGGVAYFEDLTPGVRYKLVVDSSND